MTLDNASLLVGALLVLTGAQRALLAELIVAEQRHASRWWTHLNEMRLRKELPEWANTVGAGSHPEYDLWCEQEGIESGAFRFRRPLVLIGLG